MPTEPEMPSAVPVLLLVVHIVLVCGFALYASYLIKRPSRLPNMLGWTCVTLLASACAFGVFFMWEIALGGYKPAIVDVVTYLILLAVTLSLAFAGRRLRPRDGGQRLRSSP